MNEVAVVVPDRPGNPLFRRPRHSRIRVHHRPDTWGETGPDYRNRRHWFGGRLHFLEMGLEKLMLYIIVRFPMTSVVCFVWAQALLLSIMVNGV